MTHKISSTALWNPVSTSFILVFAKDMGSNFNSRGYRLPASGGEQKVVRNEGGKIKVAQR